MPGTKNAPVLSTHDFGVARLDMSGLVGHDVTIFSQQFPGMELRSRVLSGSHRQILVESSNKFEAIGNLVSRQSVILQFPYHGEEIAVRARVQRTSAGRCYFLLEDRVTPLSQRRFYRVSMASTVRLASYPITGFLPTSLNRLRWLETDTVDFSSGGALLAVPSALEEGVHLLINLSLESVGFPRLVLAGVRHCYCTDRQGCHVGVEFVTREMLRRLVAIPKAQQLPPPLFSYSNSDRERLNKRLVKWKSTRKQGPDRSLS